MRRLLPGWVVVLVAAGAIAAGAEDRWLHVRVEDGGEGEMVRVNVPLDLAEKVLPCIRADRLQNGKVKIEGDLHGVDLHSLLDAVRSTADGEFVTVESREDNVRVAKQGGSFIVKVREKHGSKERDSETVDVKVPFPVAEALLSGGNDELDVTAAVRALKNTGDTELVSVRDGDQKVRVWVDSRQSTE